MFSHTQNLVLLQNKSVPSPFVEAFFIAEKSIFLDRNHNWSISRYLLLTLWSRFCIFHKRNQKFLQSVHAFGEVLSECIENLTISDRRSADYFFQLRVCKLTDQNLPIFDCHYFTIKFVLSKHAIQCFFITILRFRCLGPKYVISIESACYHGPIGSYIIRDEDILSVDSVSAPLSCM